MTMQVKGKVREMPFLQLPPVEPKESEQAIAPSSIELTPESIDATIARLQAYKAQIAGSPKGIQLPGAIANMDKLQLVTAIAFVGVPSVAILIGLVVLSFPAPQAASTISQQQELIRQQQQTIERLSKTQNCKALCF